MMGRGGSDRLVGELIGLARATEGNEHLISPAVTAVITECLAASRESLSGSTLETLLQRVETEKQNMVPACFSCAAPCGRNNAYDLQLLQKEEPESRALKQQILFGVQTLAAQRCPAAEDIYYPALIALGIEGIDLEILGSILQRIRAL